MSASTSLPITSNRSPSRRDLFEETLNGTLERPSIPLLWSDRSKSPITVPRSLDDYRALEGHDSRETRLRAIWKKLPKTERKGVRLHPEKAHERIEYPKPTNVDCMTKEGAESLREMYREELMDRSIDWHGFLQYVDHKETELWHIFHNQLDLDGNGHVDSTELRTALNEAGIHLSPAQLSEFMTYLTSSPHSHAISFPEFRDFLLLLPRTASTAEMYRYYEVRRFLGDDGHGVARVNMEGDVTLSAEDRHPLLSKATSGAETYIVPGEEEREPDEDIEDPHASFFAMVGHSQAFRFLLAGGLAGAVSRTATAPFDRLKVFLITRSTTSVAELLKAGDVTTATKSVRGLTALLDAIKTIHAEQGLRGFWVGNGLNVVKIFPESAIKFLSYESSKRFLAKHVDKVSDPRDISGTSRFVSGGIGGIISQFAIYPLETLKTQMMSSGRGETKSPLSVAARRTWELGGVRAYYRGLVIGLIGVFPYSAIDMSTFESLKLIYSRSTGVEEPGVLALLAFGSISGTVGATSVYPLNLVRTRLQASGSPGHPQRYINLWDVVQRTHRAEGWRGFYRGLVPTLAKVPFFIRLGLNNGLTSETVLGRACGINILCCI
ncbi:hypothetical protein FRB93_007431 [Tulasnella sp. JGI-2019a]|nr:hypothetical protein FRB93_007431 [Tulasnella sp. JGI-2019a]